MFKKLIGQLNCHIGVQADMYSLGIVFFELWHPFGTAMERHIVLSDLKQKGELPSSWVAEFPDQASLLRLLMSPSPSDRPSATELLQHAFPPRMESELLDSNNLTLERSIVAMSCEREKTIIVEACSVNGLQL